MKKTILLAVMAVMAFTAMAQTHVVRAYEALKQSSCASIERSNNSQSQGRCNGQLEICRFETTNTSSKRLVENLLDAFETDREDAYSYVNHHAGDERERYSIYYDPNNSEVVGNDKSMNYKLLSVTDPDDDNGLMRYCYVVEWQEDDDGNLSGRALKTYAPKPRSSNKLFAKRDGGPLAINIGGDTTIVVDLDSLIDLSGLGKLKDLKELKGLEKLKELDGLEILGKLGTLDGLEELKDRIIVLSGDDKDVPTDDVEWLTSFNHYRNAFKRACERESSTAVSYATSILKLCKSAKQAKLTEGELNLCRKSLKEMKKMTKDSFVKGLLDEAIKNL